MALSIFADRTHPPTDDDLAVGIPAAIDAAPRYAEGRGVRVEVRTAADVGDLVRVVEANMAP